MLVRLKPAPVLLVDDVAATGSGNKCNGPAILQFANSCRVGKIGKRPGWALCDYSGSQQMHREHSQGTSTTLACYGSSGIALVKFGIVVA